MSAASQAQIEKLQIADDTKNYILKKLNPVLEEMVTCIVVDMPDDLPQYIYNWLMKKAGIAPGGAKNVSASDAAAENEFLKEQLANVRRSSAMMAKLEAQVLEQLKETADKEEDSEEDDDDDDVDELPENFLMPDKDRGKARASVSAEAYGQWNQKQDFTPPVHPKTDEQKERVRASLVKSFLFSNVDDKDMATVIDAMLEVKLGDKERVIKQGEDGDCLFVIESGDLDCYKKFPDVEEEKVVKTCVAGDAFGELALLYNCPRAASVESRGDCVLWKLDRETFNHIVKDAAARKREKYESFLKSVPLLAGIGAYELSQVADALKPRECGDGEEIVKEGDAGDTFYIVEEGTAVALKGDSQVMEYKSGDYFGELALLQNAPRAATVKTTGNAKVLALDRRSFRRLLGGLEDLLKKGASRYEK